MLKWLAALLPRCESFAFSLLSRPNKSVQKAQLRDCTRNEERGKERGCQLPLLLVVVSMKID